jgi:hypothetical protein
MTATMTAPGTWVDPGGVPSPPDPEVPEKAKRRRFSAEYKLAILREADACTQPGQIGALLRRERLYSSHLVDWRRQRDTGALQALARKRDSKPADPARVEVEGSGGVPRASGARAVTRGEEPQDDWSSSSSPHNFNRRIRF